MSGPIGVFDSGIGGLSIVQALCEELPSEEIVYFADLARLPYGEKTADQIRQFSLQVARHLLAQGAKLIVVACSTASSVALEHLQRELEVPVVGILNDRLMKDIVEESPRKKIGVISTTLTAKSGAFRKWVQAIHPDVDVVSEPCPVLVDKISAGDLDSLSTREVAHMYLDPLVEREKVDTVVLGCTHFNFIEGMIREILPKNVRLIAPPKSVALGVRDLLQSRGALASKCLRGQVKVGTSKPDPVFSRFVQTLFGISQEKIALSL